MTLFSDHPDDVAQRWTDRFENCLTFGEVDQECRRAQMAGVDARLVATLKRDTEARIRGVELLYEALGAEL